MTRDVLDDVHFSYCSDVVIVVYETEDKSIDSGQSLKVGIDVNEEGGSFWKS